MNQASFAWNNHSLAGCLFEKTLEKADHVVGTAAESELPKTVDLSPWCSDIEDQGNTNSCTANAIVGALEFHQRRAGLAVTDLSRLFVYYNARKLNDMEAEDCGSYIHHVMAAVMAYGACEERIWPFDPTLCKVRPSEQAYANALAFQAVQFARAPLGLAAIHAVASGIPVVFATYIPPEFYHHADQTGVMPAPQAEVVPQFGHAMLLVGYDLDAGHWIVRNSHGSAFARNGYVNIPFETLAAYSVPEHFWTIGAIDQTAGLQRSEEPLDQSNLQSPSHLRVDLTELRQSLRKELSSDLTAKTAGFHNRLRS